MKVVALASALAFSVLGTDMQMRALGTVPKNLLANPGFETMDKDGSPEGYTKSPGSVFRCVADRVHGGRYCAEYRNGSGAGFIAARNRNIRRGLRLVARGEESEAGGGHADDQGLVCGERSVPALLENSSIGARVFGGNFSTDAASATVYTLRDNLSGSPKTTAAAARMVEDVLAHGNRPGMNGIWLQFGKSVVSYRID